MDDNEGSVDWWMKQKERQWCPVNNRVVKNEDKVQAVE
jgi:hypothetical protein